MSTATEAIIKKLECTFRIPSSPGLFVSTLPIEYTNAILPAIAELRRLSTYEPPQAQIDESACERWFLQQYPQRESLGPSDKAGWLAALAWERARKEAKP